MHQDFYTSLDLATVDNSASQPCSAGSVAETETLSSRRLSDMSNKPSMHPFPATKRRQMNTPTAKQVPKKRPRARVQNKENDTGKPKRGK